MLAWMNREAIEQTLTTGRVVYLRSRQALYGKGDTAGNGGLVSLRFDCDADAILLSVNQRAQPATRIEPLFYLDVRGDSVVVDGEPVS